jgi:hypothetical protein
MSVQEEFVKSKEFVEVLNNWLAKVHATTKPEKREVIEKGYGEVIRTMARLLDAVQPGVINGDWVKKGPFMPGGGGAGDLYLHDSIRPKRSGFSADNGDDDNDRSRVCATRRPVTRETHRRSAPQGMTPGGRRRRARGAGAATGAGRRRPPAARTQAGLLWRGSGRKARPLPRLTSAPA